MRPHWLMPTACVSLFLAATIAVGRPFQADVGLESPIYNATLAAREEPQWGSVKGRIVWGGKNVPERKPVKVGDRDKECCLKNGPILDDTWVVNPKNKGLRDTFVWLASPKEKLPIHPDLRKIKTPKVFIDQPHCQFVPHSLAMREGQVLIIKNDSPIAHSANVDGNPQRNPPRGLVCPAGSEQILRDLSADFLIIQCGHHSWMQARLMVFDHPYFAVSDENGAFEIKDAPAGDFRIMVRHSTGLWLDAAMGKNGRHLSIPAGKVVDVGDVTFLPIDD